MADRSGSSGICSPESPVALTADEALRDAAKRGELTYVSICPRAGRGGVVFCAWYRGASEGLSGFGEDADPGKAIAAAIADAKAPRRKAKADFDFG
jgi:uncharacterized protein YodC (DUF2158 family)